MIRKTGNRAFAALNRILSLPGSQALGSIDISVAQPTVDMGTVMQSSIAQDWFFYREEAISGATTVEYNLRPWEPSDWLVVAQNGQLQSAPEAIPDDHDLFIWQFGMRVNSTGAFTNAVLYRLNNYGGGTLFTNTGRTMLFYGDAAARTVVYAASPVNSIQSPIPWAFPASMRGSFEGCTLSINTSTDLEWGAMMRVYSAPPGVFSPLR